MQEVKCVSMKACQTLTGLCFHLLEYNDDVDDDVGAEQLAANETFTVGDMVMTRDQYSYLYSNVSFKRHGLSRVFSHWPKGVVPVKLDESLPFITRSRVFEAIDYLESVSCVRFDVAPDYASDYVQVMKGNGCSSQIGFLNIGQQFMKLSTGCLKGNIIHEFLHTLGFLHMHTATDRDNFVRINYNNIHKEFVKNFKVVRSYVSMYHTQYDYRSIMHYSKTAFAIDKKRNTITPFERVSSMGQRDSKKFIVLLPLLKLYFL